jgi:hypothetical protein
MKRIKIFAVAALFFVMNACYVHYRDVSGHHGQSIVFDAQAACYWNESYGDYVWYFDAWVDNPLGIHNTAQVWADVYFDNRLVDSHQLVHDRAIGHEYHWFIHKIERLETNLWCGSRYEVDFIAFDWDGGYDVLTVFPKYQN